MRRSRERTETDDAIIIQPRMSLRESLERITLTAISVLMMGGGIVLLVHLYFGEAGVRTLLIGGGFVCIVMFVWIVTLFTLGVSTKSTHKTVKNVAESIAVSDEMRSQAQMMQMMALLARQQQDVQRLYGPPHGFYPPAYPPSPYGMPMPPAREERFDYQGHFDSDDFDSTSTGLR